MARKSGADKSAPAKRKGKDGKSYTTERKAKLKKKAKPSLSVKQLENQLRTQL